LAEVIPAREVQAPRRFRLRPGAAGELHTAERRLTAHACGRDVPVLALIQLGARMSPFSMMIQGFASSASIASAAACCRTRFAHESGSSALSPSPAFDRRRSWCGCLVPRTSARAEDGPERRRWAAARLSRLLARRLSRARRVPYPARPPASLPAGNGEPGFGAVPGFLPPRKLGANPLKHLATPVGLEPTTCRLEGGCCGRLSCC